MNNGIGHCNDMVRDTSLDTLTNNYNKGDFTLFNFDYLMQRLNIDAVYPYFKSIEIAEALDSNGDFTLDALITRNMLSSGTKITVKGMQDIMNTLDRHWNLVSNYAFMYVLEKDRKVRGEDNYVSKYTVEELTDYISLFSFNAIFVNTIRMTLIFLDDIVKYIDEENPDKSRRYGKEVIEKRLAANKFAMVEIKRTWDKIQDSCITESFQSFLVCQGARRPLIDAVDRLLTPIEKVISDNKVITKVVNEDITECKFFASVYDFAEELIAMMRDYQKQVLIKDDEE